MADKNKKKYIEDTTRSLIELKMRLLEDKPHYKKYVSIRKTTDTIMNKLLKYYGDGNYNFECVWEEIIEIISRENTCLKNDINLNWQEDKDILVDMVLFRTIPNVKCLTSEFLSKKLYENEEEKKKIRMDNNETIINLFK